MRKAASVLFLVLLLTIVFVSWLRIQPGKANPSTWIVPDDYPTILEAVGAANDGDTIYVRAGTYYENVIVHKNLTFIGDNGNTVVKDNGTGTVFYLEALVETRINCSMTGFTIQDSVAGITVNEEFPYDSEYGGETLVRLFNLTVKNCSRGIYLPNERMSPLVTLDNCSLSSNGAGIYYYSGYTQLTNCLLSQNQYGFSGHGSLDLRNCTIRLSTVAGIEGVTSEDAACHIRCEDCLFQQNERGISTSSETMGVRLDVIRCTFIKNKYGIQPTGDVHRNSINVSDSAFYNCDVGVEGASLIKNSTIALNNVGVFGGYNVVSDNIIEFNLIGIEYPNRSGGTVTNNTFLNNFILAISYTYEEGFGGYSGNIFHNDFINNTRQAHVESGVTAGDVIWNEIYPIGGNYWSDYEGIDEFGGPYQNLTGSDGIGDIPYDIVENNRDNYPLMELISLPAPPLLSMPLTPRARFSSYLTMPVVNESVVFDASWSKDIDGEVVAYTWNFGDGMGLVETGPQTTHFYNTTGMYNVSLTVTDNDGLNDTVTIPLSVGKMPSTVTILADPAEITIRENTTISGVIVPSRPDVNMTVWCRFESEDWVTLANHTTDVNSEYQYTWGPSKTGIYALKSSWTGDEYTLANESAIVNFNCMNISSSISIATSSASTYVGYRVNVTGTLMDMYGVPLSDKTVVLYYTFSGIDTWTPITSDNTDSSGKYSAV